MKIGDEDKGLKVFRGNYEVKSHSKLAGEIEISKNEFAIYTKDGIYFPLEVQLEGKKRMEVKDFLNGFQSFEQIKMA